MKSASSLAYSVMQGGDNEEHGSLLSRKEKSILQAKLTKLAIQIGYAGN
jgi:hypothetical protein